MKVTRYPVILVHGILIKDFHIFKSFGKIEESLKKNGYSVSTAPTDGFGTIENNAAQLKEYVRKILKEQHAEKVNLIAHSKGGLDCIHMIKALGMEDSVASLTTLCTPHLGFANRLVYSRLSQVDFKVYCILDKPVVQGFRRYEARLSGGVQAA